MKKKTIYGDRALFLLDLLPLLLVFGVAPYGHLGANTKRGAMLEGAKRDLKIVLDEMVFLWTTTSQLTTGKNWFLDFLVHE
jgi:hypothetical protein